MPWLTFSKPMSLKKEKSKLEKKEKELNKIPKTKPTINIIKLVRRLKLILNIKKGIVKIANNAALWTKKATTNKKK